MTADISREACNEMAARLHRMGEYEVAQLEGYSLWPFADTILALRAALDAAEARQPTVAEAARVLLADQAAFAAMVDAAEISAGQGVSFNVVIGRALRSIAGGVE